MTHRIGALIAGLALVATSMLTTAGIATAAPSGGIAAASNCNGYNYEGPFVQQGLGYSSKAVVMLDSCVANEVESILQTGGTAGEVVAGITTKFPSLVVGSAIFGYMSGAAGNAIETCANQANGRGIIFDVVVASTGAVFISNCRAQTPAVTPPNCPPGKVCPFTAKENA
ncbi:hypothetical protein [Arthrobacter castelli]|uniref:hypothetical protein n=1 Tax=Arthrobacter castelli TaxID=271431 RepID=UPI00047D7291|nr:hypothetical protein [Arthrobacter castelli]